MKSLTLFRHAKTERNSDSGRDFDRKLNDRGSTDALRIGQEIRQLGMAFDLILSSPASRAVETARLAGLAPTYDERIYDASTGDLLAIIQEADDAANSIMLVGHNPGFERLASRLIGDDVEMPTCSLAEIALPIERWKDVGGDGGELVRFLTPKELD